MTKDERLKYQAEQRDMRAEARRRVSGPLSIPMTKQERRTAQRAEIDRRRIELSAIKEPAEKQPPSIPLTKQERSTAQEERRQMQAEIVRHRIQISAIQLAEAQKRYEEACAVF